MLIRRSPALLLAALVLSACSDRTTAPPAASTTTPSAPSATAPQPQTAIGRKVQEGMNEARRKLATENIDLGKIRITANNGGLTTMRTDDKTASDGRPSAQITPQGDLIIDGRTVDSDAAQRALLLAYRRQIEAIASAGMDIGVQGADLGVRAATDAISSIFSGDTEGVEARVNAEAAKIEASAKRLCDLLPGLLQAQQALSATLPAFAPYATLKPSDIDECHRDGAPAAATQARVRDEIRDGIRSGVRGAVQSATPDTGRAQDAAAEADAATASTSNR